ncbi:hypothetical protein AB0I28_16160 [Phytomonospora sp. NPDC050363]|uniref:hypothetical protein n=1 Tax=Phytomonospora sp. NPDC050363 TaxID=3155642 RepID=UPI0033DBB5A1
MNWARRITLAAAVTTAAVVGIAPTAQASQNIGWIYSEGGNGRGNFDADVSGRAGVEAISACDVKTDGNSIWVALYKGTPSAPRGIVAEVIDTQNNGDCITTSGNFATDETNVFLQVCDREGGTGRLFDCVLSPVVKA